MKDVHTSRVSQASRKPLQCIDVTTADALTLSKSRSKPTAMHLIFLYSDTTRLFFQSFLKWKNIVTFKFSMSPFKNDINGYPSCPAFSQFDWLIIGQDSAILPDGFSCETKLKLHVDQNCLKILRKLRKVMKLEKILFINLVSEYFSGNSQCVFGQRSENLKIMNRKPWENDFRLIS